MLDSYKKNYIRIYFWRILSFVIGFFSLFIVIPYLSSNKEVYGLYTFCASFQLYLSYADIGFLSAGQKYAAEAFAKGNRQEEYNLLGFVGFVLLCLVIPFTIFLLYCAYNPSIVLTGLDDNDCSIIRSLFLIMALVTPVQFFLQRVVQSVLVIRIKDYISSRIDAVGSVVKILSVFYFFTEGRYMIVEYFLLINIVNILCCLISIYYISRVEAYSFWSLFRAVCWSRSSFKKMKRLAFTSLGGTFSGLLCYELDLLIVGKLYSVAEVATYSVCFSIISFVRNISNIIYGPYNQRFNHFVANNDTVSIKGLASNMVKYTYPLFVFGCFLMATVSKYFILMWVGPQYLDSIIVLQVLIFVFIFQYFDTTASYLCVSKEDFKSINIKSIFQPIIFITCIFVGRLWTDHVVSFAIAKTIAAVSAGLYWMFILTRWINLWRVVRPFLVQVICFTFLICGLTRYSLPILFPDPTKESSQLLLLIMILLAAFSVYCLFVYLSNRGVRTYITKSIKIWKK